MYILPVYLYLFFVFYANYCNHQLWAHGYPPYIMRTHSQSPTPHQVRGDIYIYIYTYTHTYIYIYKKKIYIILCTLRSLAVLLFWTLSSMWCIAWAQRTRVVPFSPVDFWLHVCSMLRHGGFIFGIALSEDPFSSVLPGEKVLHYFERHTLFSIFVVMCLWHVFCFAS